MTESETREGISGLKRSGTTCSAGGMRGVLAAGPLEDFLGIYGPDYIDRVEAEARRDRRLAWALGEVWGWTMTDDVWARVQRAALEWQTVI